MLELQCPGTNYFLPRENNYRYFFFSLNYRVTEQNYLNFKVFSPEAFPGAYDRVSLRLPSVGLPGDACGLKH